jgi:hypothetical protein
VRCGGPTLTNHATINTPIIIRMSRRSTAPLSNMSTFMDVQGLEFAFKVVLFVSPRLVGVTAAASCWLLKLLLSSSPITLRVR